jgi:thioredoxin 2
MRLVKVDVDAVPTIAERFGIHGIPTVALTLHGREVARHVGAVSADQLERWVLGHVPADRRAG